MTCEVQIASTTAPERLTASRIEHEHQHRRAITLRWQMGEFLDIDLVRWLTKNNTFKVRATLPIVANGNTVAIHVWFD